MKKTIKIKVTDLEEYLGIHFQDDVLHMELSRVDAARLAVELIEGLAGARRGDKSSYINARQGLCYKIDRIRLY